MLTIAKTKPERLNMNGGRKTLGNYVLSGDQQEILK